MFENLRAAKAAHFTLSGMKGPAAKSNHRAWSADLLFYGAKVGSVSASDLKREVNLVLDERLQKQIIDVLKKAGFQLDLENSPTPSTSPDTPSKYMSLAIAQIADEMDLAKELKISARTQTLILLRSNPKKATVFSERFSPEVKARLSAQYGDELIEFLNESLKGL